MRVLRATFMCTMRMPSPEEVRCQTLWSEVMGDVLSRGQTQGLCKSSYLLSTSSAHSVYPLKIHTFRQCVLIIPISPHLPATPLRPLPCLPNPSLLCCRSSLSPFSASLGTGAWANCQAHAAGERLHPCVLRLPAASLLVLLSGLGDFLTPILSFVL